MNGPVRAVLVAVPAHDEADEVADCLAHLRRAVLHAQDPAREVTVAVAAHRCTDATYDVAAQAFADWPGPHLLVRDEVSTGVGDVRRRLVERACRSTTDPARTWVLSTDADSRVPVDWITELLRLGGSARAAAVAGMVELRDWQPPARLRARYEELLATKIHGAGHDHVYGANLAVRLDAYRRVGGFRSVVGEDQDLVDRLHAAGERVLGAFSPMVSTSARMPGRASGGLGELLEWMDAQDRPADVPA